MERKIALTYVVLLSILAISAGMLIQDIFLEESSAETQIAPEPAKDAGKNSNWHKSVENRTLRNATFAGGCFWCIEAVFDNKKGVKQAISGYAGGKESTATYQQVLTGNTDHREAVRVKYYPSVVSYEELLDSYWRSINPTDPGGQFADRGFQYTTAIYVHNERQRQIALESRQNLSESGKFEKPIVTKILNYTTFFRAEEKHQNYSQKNTLQYKAYERASGRTGYVESKWNDE